jgi:hypothetical protein
MLGLGQHILLGNVVDLCRALGNTLHFVMLLGLGQHTSLGNVVGLRKTLYWVILLVYVGPWATHFTG